MPEYKNNIVKTIDPNNSIACHWENNLSKKGIRFPFVAPEVLEFYTLKKSFLFLPFWLPKSHFHCFIVLITRLVAEMHYFLMEISNKDWKKNQIQLSEN